MEIVLADQSCFLWGARFIRNLIQLDHSPAAKIYVFECLHGCGNIDPPASEFNETEVSSARRLLSWNTLDILYMHEQQPITILLDCLDWISAALHVVCDIELKLHITRIAGVEHTVNFLWALANR